MKGRASARRSPTEGRADAKSLETIRILFVFPRKGVGLCLEDRLLQKNAHRLQSIKHKNALSGK